MSRDPGDSFTPRRTPAGCPDEEQLESFFASGAAQKRGGPLAEHVQRCPRCAAWLRDAQADENLLADVRDALAATVWLMPGGGQSSDFHGATSVARGGRAELSSQPVLRGYRILRKLAEGGMGVVYEAEQDRPRRRVALKVIRAQRRLDLTHQRLFQREADALARLKHPAIAAIHEAGITQAGDPFLAMELVEGATLRDFAATQPSLPTRIELFRRIAEGIHYAHQRGVIHRDLKPANILVSNDGESTAPAAQPSADPRLRTGVAAPKILDFGLARILDDDERDDATITQIGRVRGTLPYMSPEQARGSRDEVDARSDVYALGVILYELLTGRLPYTLPRDSLPDALRIICEQPPHPPGRELPALRGDLEVILHKSLQKRPEDRYSSAAALAEDLDRYLHGRPILARPPSISYQLRKFVRRHKLIAALALALAVTVLGSGVTLAVLYGQARQSQRAAEDSATLARSQAAKAETVSTFLEELLGSLEPDSALGREPTVRQTLEAAEERLNAGELAGQPLIQARLRATIGRAYRSLSLFPAAESHLKQALELRRQFGASDYELAESLADLGQCAQLRADYAAAEDLHRQARDRFERSDDAAGRVEAARETIAIGQAIMNDARLDQARAYLEDGLARLRTLLGDEHDHVAAGLHMLAAWHHTRGQFEQAEPLLREAIRIRKQLFGEQHPKVARTLHNLASLLGETGRYAESADLLREVLAIRRTVYRQPSRETASTLHSLAIVLGATGDDRESERLLREALAMRRDIHGDSHPDVAASLTALGNLLYRRGGDEQEAESLIEEGLKIRRDLFGNDHASVAASLQALANARRRRGDVAGIVPLYREALEIRRRRSPAGHPDIAAALAVLAEGLMATGNLDEPPALLDEALSIRRAALGPDHATVADVLMSLGRVHLKCGEYPQAIALLEQVLAIRQKRLGADHPQTAVALTSLGIVHRLSGDYAQSMEELGDALEIYRRRYGESHPEVAGALQNLAETAAALDDFALAEQHYQQAIEILKATRGPGHRDTIDVIERLIDLYERMNRPADAAGLRALLPADSQR